MNILLIKYGELSTKGGNRKFFIKALANNIRVSLKDYNFKLSVTFNHITVETEDDCDEVVKLIQNVFGIHKIIKVKIIKPDYELLKTEVLNSIGNFEGDTFKVDIKRSDKDFPLESPEITRQIGGLILKNTDLKVDVHNPDFMFKIEIRKEAYFIYEKEYQGAGGYPVGIQGKAVLMLSGGIDSPVAAYLAMKRGLKLIPIYFDSPPHTSPQALDKVERLVKVLSKYDPDLKLKVIHFTEIQETIYKTCKHEYLITLMRRMMYRLAEKVARYNKAKAIINGESIGQVASQTIESISVINEVVRMPVIRPVACYDKLEIIDVAKRIGTYDISILPFEDCCTVFVPKNPVIKPDLKTCLEFEENYDSNALLNNAFPK